MKEASEIGSYGEPVAKCSESDPSAPGIEVELHEDFKSGTEPYITISLPYELWAEDYEGAGLFIVNLKDVLEHYFENYWYYSGGEDAQPIIDMFRNYADKLQEDIKVRSKGLITEKNMNKRDEEFGQFIGFFAFEDDGGWSKQVWNAAWHACLMYIIERSNKDKPVEQPTDA